MTDAFSDLVMPVFQQVIELKDSLSWGDSPPTLESVKARMKALVLEVDRRAGADAGLASEFVLARYGLVAWIDEVLTESNWGQSVGWGSEDHVLEWNLYQTNLRAGRFFDQAETAYKAVSQARSSSDPLEVYLLCVALGFRGALRGREKDCKNWVEWVYTKILEASPMADKPFPDEPTSALACELEPRRGPGLLLKVSILTAITALATLLGYIASVHFEYDQTRS